MKAGNKGFTLLELMIALALIGLLTVLLFAGLKLGSNAWDRTESSLDRSDTKRLVWNFLHTHLRQARLVTIALETETNTQAIFSGLPDGMEFVSPMTASLGAGGVYILRLEMVEKGGDMQLRLSRWLNHPEILQGAEPIPAWHPLSAENNGQQRYSETGLNAYYSESILVDQVRSLQIRYFGPEQDSNGKPDSDIPVGWMNEWLQRRELPWAVSVSIHDGVTQWPEMILTLPR